VRFDGPLPKPKLLEISKDRGVCGAGSHYAQDLVVGAGGGIRYAVVSVTGLSDGAGFEPLPRVRFEQKECEYRPHVLAFPAGSTVEIINADGILHTIHTDSVKNPAFNLAQPGFKKRISVVIRYPELIQVTCDAHNWMKAFWFAAANPYYAVTDHDGAFVIRNVPAGKYRLEVWQEKLGTLSREVTVAPDRTTTVEFVYRPSKS
jgi:hypothetical protein